VAEHVGDHVLTVRSNAVVLVGSLLGSTDMEVVNATLSMAEDHISQHLAAATAVTNTISKNIVFLPAYVEAALVTPQPTSIPTTSSANSPLQPQGVGSKPVRRLKTTWGCCLDCQVDESGTPMDLSDGCLFLLAQLSQHAGPPREIARSYLQAALALLRTDTFKGADRLHTSLLTHTHESFLPSLPNEVHAIFTDDAESLTPVVAAAAQYHTFAAKQAAARTLMTALKT